MSLDYPEYVKLKAKHPLLGLLWRVGDTGYYLSIFGAFLMPLSLVGGRLTAADGEKILLLSWRDVILLAIASCICCIVLWYVSCWLKNLAFKWGGGIEQYYDTKN